VICQEAIDLNLQVMVDGVTPPPPFALSCDVVSNVAIITHQLFLCPSDGPNCSSVPVMGKHFWEGAKEKKKKL
jgi:hypothetical protein